MQSPLRYLRIWMARNGLWPTTRYARVACFVLAFDLLLFALKKILDLAGSFYGQSLNFWIMLLAFVSAALFLSLAYRWLKARTLWRLRNRLIVTYVFIGVIPAILLVTMAVGMFYVFAGQFANFVVTSELNAKLKSLGVMNSAVASAIASRLEKGEAPTREFLEAATQQDSVVTARKICVWADGKSQPICSGDGTTTPLAFPSFLKERFDAIVHDDHALYLRSAVKLNRKDKTIVVISSEPLDEALLRRLVPDFGEITVFEHTQRLRVAEGRLPPPGGILDLEIQAPPLMPDVVAPLSIVDWRTGETDPQGWLHVRTRPSALYPRLFVDTDVVQGIESVLIILAVVFALIVGVALFIGTRLTQTVTKAVAQLYLATRHINQGDFSHRIPVKSDDQLSTLAHSFNSMSESLQKLLEEQKEKQKLENELIIAQEVQAQLFPQKIVQLPSLEVHGFCRPARTVSGDYYDFLRVDDHRMVMAVGDVSGKGISAALLMATIHSAVRAYSLEGIPILREPQNAGNENSVAIAVRGVEVSTAALLTLLNHQIFESTPAEKYATMFLGFYDGREHTLTYSNGGHLPPVILGQNGGIRRLDRGGTVVGLFGKVEYEEDVASLSEGDIFLAYSDGVTEPENDYGEFGEQRLINLVWENRHLPLAKISEIVTAAVDDWIGAGEQPDDVTLVLARVR
ncbi:MAG TPA: SpoIIE family protein phosphatase [Terriglobales bacterium]|nr:SpoIIE family protein phosphatase [Terriglobales bacterium]